MKRLNITRNRGENSIDILSNEESEHKMYSDFKG